MNSVKKWLTQYIAAASFSTSVLFVLPGLPLDCRSLFISVVRGILSKSFTRAGQFSRHKSVKGLKFQIGRQDARVIHKELLVAQYTRAYSKPEAAVNQKNVSRGFDTRSKFSMGVYASCHGSQSNGEQNGKWWRLRTSAKWNTRKERETLAARYRIPITNIIECRRHWAWRCSLNKSMYVYASACVLCGCVLIQGVPK